MTPWMVLTVFVAAINLTIFIALRGRWDRQVPFLAVASVVGTVAGNAIGTRTGLELVRIGDFSLLAACLLAQLAMLATDLLAQLGPSRPPPERAARGRRDGDRMDR